MVHTERDCGKLLGDLQLQVLLVDDRAALDQDLTVEEVQEAIVGLQLGKATDPNALPVDLYKCVANILARHMLALFQEAKTVGSLPPDQREATIVVIHKKGKPQTECSAYRPISLINLEAKVLTNSE
ncbi:hypothetical protein NDU88_004070 [Pleurodeles waltl]|uniref:Uncharacterized protein n=1 Tax=Pleurodeles waltl TaxID=8319 RepID=A0AAV7TQX1_PLEWA|nr:hypothetical protein NDU88_004070 [Pleurodeles waltl]